MRTTAQPKSELVPRFPGDFVDRLRSKLSLTYREFFETINLCVPFDVDVREHTGALQIVACSPKQTLCLGDGARTLWMTHGEIVSIVNSTHFNVKKEG